MPETKRLLVRPLRESDTDALFAVLSDPAVMRYIEPPYTRERTASFIRDFGMKPNPAVWAVIRKDTGALIGHLIYHSVEGEAWELGWVLGREHWGQGFAAELTAAVINDAGARGIPALVMECAEAQTATRHIAARFGFVPSGREGELLSFRKEMSKFSPQTP